MKVYGILLLTLISLTACGLTNSAQDKFCPNNNNTLQCPVCEECKDFSELDAVVYYFDNNVKTGLLEFIRRSDQSLDCAIVRVDDKDFLRPISNTDDIAEVRILMNKESVMECSGGCIPYQESLYNDLWAEGVDIKLINDLHENFCVSEEGVFLFTNYFDEKTRYDHGYFLKSDGLTSVFKGRFENLWEESE